MICPQCQAANLNDVTVCSSCGAAIPSGSSHIDPAATTDPVSPQNNDIPSASSSIEALTSEELNAQAELLAQKVREKRARAALASAASSNSLSADTPVTPPKVQQLEREMSMLLGLVSISVVGIASLMFYFNMPEYRKAELVAFMNKGGEKTIQTANDQSPHASSTLPAKEAEVPMSAETRQESAPVEVVDAPEAQPGMMQLAVAENESPSANAQPTSTLETNLAKKTDQLSLSPRNKQHVEAETTNPPTGLIPATKASRTTKVAVADKSVMSNKSRKREVAGCNPNAKGTECSHRYVVTFKRFWGPILEERVYPTREMSMRAQDLWYREGKILEVDGSINEAYVVKPKDFSPVPGFPVS
jgi:hypothetical protein